MKLNNIEQEIFKGYPNVNVDLDRLYAKFGDSEISDVLKTYVRNPISVSDLIRIDSKKSYGDYKEKRKAYNNVLYTLFNTLDETQQEHIVNLVLEGDKTVMNIFLSNPQIKLNENQFELLFNHEDFNVRKALIENKNIPISIDRINAGLLNYDGRLNISYAKRGDSGILKKTIDALINDTNEDSFSNEAVLQELLKNKHIHFDEIQVQHFLDSDNFILRAECARNHNIEFTPEQIEKGLDDEGFEYERYDDTYNDYNPTDVKVAFLNNPNVKIPHHAIQSILYGYKSNEYLIQVLVQRDDLHLNERDMDTVLKMCNRASVSLLENKHVFLNDHQFLGFLYKEKYTPEILTKYYLSRDNVEVSDLVMSLLKTFPSEEIQKYVQEKESEIVNRPKMK